jgi:three-Cys-motif partner protein
MSQKHPVVWEAAPHTIAKIDILKGYLKAWFRILGATRPGQVILYIDGFAGPGRYTNHPEGSPVAVLQVARDAFYSMGEKFVARKIHCCFIDSDAKVFEVLSDSIAKFEKVPGIGVTKMCCEFTEGIQKLRDEFPGPFAGEGPLFVFADPFGGTGISFQTFAQCMEGDTAELLINLDADGIARIFAANNNNRDEQLTDVFGDESWRTALTVGGDPKKLCVEILDLYKLRLKSLPGKILIWSFAMRGKKDALNYHLVFATRHRLGLTRMKEAMKAIDQTGSYQFSDAHAGQTVLFRDDDVSSYADQMFAQFDGQTISLDDAADFAAETPFPNEKGMLAVLEKRGQLQVEPTKGQKRRANTYAEGKVAALRFGRFGTPSTDGDLFKDHARQDTH